MAITAPFREAMPGDISPFDVYGDLTAYEYCFVQQRAAVNRTVEAYSSGLSAGVLCNRPIEEASVTSAKFQTVAQVQTRGVALVKAGSGALAAGDWVKVGTGGVGDKATPTAADIIVGQCIVGAAAGLPASVRLMGPFTYAVT